MIWIKYSKLTVTLGFMITLSMVKSSIITSLGKPTDNIQNVSFIKDIIENVKKETNKLT